LADTANDVSLGDNPGHLSAIVTNDDQVLSWAIQQFRRVDQQGIDFHRD
jgi:hypothetical protein